MQEFLEYLVQSLQGHFFSKNKDIHFFFKKKYDSKLNSHMAQIEPSITTQRFK